MNDLPQIQNDIQALYKHNKWKTNSTLLIVAMTEELGELAARWLAEHPGYEKSLKNTDTIEDCVGDLGQLLLQFCNNQKLNFEECVKASLEDRKK